MKQIDTSKLILKLRVFVVRFFVGLVVSLPIIFTFGLYFITPDTPITYKEKRFALYAFVIFVVGSLTVFVLIRNAVVTNTAFLIRLREQIAKTGKSLDSYELTLKNNIRGMEKLQKRIQDLSDEFRKSSLK